MAMKSWKYQGKDVFLTYIQDKLNSLGHENYADTPSKSQVPLNTTAISLKDQVQQLLRMKKHYLTAMQSAFPPSQGSNNKPPFDPSKDGRPNVGYTESRIISEFLVYSSLIDEQTLFKHQLMSLDLKMFEVLEMVKTQMSNTDIPEEQGISLEQVITRKAKFFNKMVFKNKELLGYFEQLADIRLRTLSECKSEIVIEEDEMDEQEKEEFPEKHLKVKNSSSQSQKTHKQLSQNYQGDEEVLTGGESDTRNVDKKYVKRFITKPKNPKKKYVEQEQNYYASQQEEKHKKIRPLNWRHYTEQGFDTDKQKIDDKQ